MFLILTSACTRPASSAGTEPATSAVGPCGAADLQTSSNSNGATGSIALGVTLVNTSKSLCAMEGTPQVALTANGQTLDVQMLQAPADQTPPAPATLTVAPGESVIAILIWRNYCGETLPGGPTIRLTLGTGEKLDIRADAYAVPRCDVKTEPSTLTVNPYSYPP